MIRASHDLTQAESKPDTTPKLLLGVITFMPHFYRENRLPLSES